MIMMSLFSVFDPVSYFGVSINWVILMLVVYMVPTGLYFVGGSYEKFWGLGMSGLGVSFKEVAGGNYLGVVWVSVGVFFYLGVSNLWGLLPFIFTGTAHPVVTMGLGIVFWLSFFMMGWGKSLVNSAAHLVPQGSPLLLSPVLVVIESVSHLMRPFTLSIRLAANMMAGHLIVGLLASISLVSVGGFVSSLALQGMLLVLEIGVAVIQGFVFSILVLLYALEYY